ncbi:MAG: type II toxin-antitoxin system YafQ family toxin [Oscillospiraceae bacterium]
MKYTLEMTSSFKHDFKVIKKRGYDLSLLFKVIELLSNGESLPEKYKDHSLVGNFKGFRECHIQPDWLLIYKIDNDKLILLLTSTGSHSDLFDL